MYTYIYTCIYTHSFLHFGVHSCGGGRDDLQVPDSWPRTPPPQATLPGVAASMGIDQP